MAENRTHYTLYNEGYAIECCGDECLMLTDHTLNILTLSSRLEKLSIPHTEYFPFGDVNSDQLTILVPKEVPGITHNTKMYLQQIIESLNHAVFVPKTKISGYALEIEDVSIAEQEMLTTRLCDKSVHGKPVTCAMIKSRNDLTKFTTLVTAEENSDIVLRELFATRVQLQMFPALEVRLTAEKQMRDKIYYNSCDEKSTPYGSEFCVFQTDHSGSVNKNLFHLRFYRVGKTGYIYNMDLVKNTSDRNHVVAKAKFDALHVEQYHILSKQFLSYMTRPVLVDTGKDAMEPEALKEIVETVYGHCEMGDYRFSRLLLDKISNKVFSLLYKKTPDEVIAIINDAQKGKKMLESVVRNYQKECPTVDLRVDAALLLSNFDKLKNVLTEVISNLDAHEEQIKSYSINGLSLDETIELANLELEEKKAAILEREKEVLDQIKKRNRDKNINMDDKLTQ